MFFVNNFNVSEFVVGQRLNLFCYRVSFTFGIYRVHHCGRLRVNEQVVRHFSNIVRTYLKFLKQTNY